MTEPGGAVTFTFGERTVTARVGQSIAAALYAAGVRVFSRSFKYHRPRGLFCVAGECPNCLMQVDGRPNVRTCIEPARDGQVVLPQNAWPSLDFDALRLFDRLDRFLPVGFYYKRFHKPRWLWPLFEHVVRHIAGLGTIDPHAAPLVEAEVEHLHADVCVVGGGPAGMAAAEAAAEAGADVLLLERGPVLGGHLLYESAKPAAAEESATRLRAHPRVRVRLGTTAFGLYEGNLLAAFCGERFLKVRARQVIVATGGRQRPFVFHNNDLPGIMLGDGVLRLARLHGVLAGRRAVVLADGDEGTHLARQLHELGIEVAALVDVRSAAPALAAVGNRHVKGVLHGERGERVVCDLVCHASGLVPANELLLQGGMRFRWDQGTWVPAQAVPGLWGAGRAAGVFEPDAEVLHGRQVGAEAAAAARGVGQASPLAQTLGASGDACPTPRAPCPSRGGRKSFICLCEDVTEKDLEQAVAEGFDHVETLKRYATVSMGPCQGKVCGLTASEVCARLTGRDLNATGTTTSRPPAVPVELGVLAADRRHQPVRRTPLHHWHAAAGAVWIDAGQWKRPESYGDPAAEACAVRNVVGLIDVSTLGKIELIGPDSAELLERIYLNTWKDLKAGRTRYGAMCNEDGVLFDDGVGARLGPEHFYVTATTGNAEGVFQWLELWRATWRLDVRLLNRTAALGAVNLTGPRAREVLARITSLDVSPAAFPYLAFREGAVAGVPCRLMRLGFVGELGYEIHCPASHTAHLWEALLEAGRDVGVRPFGVEAQRILRLEKGHLIIGVDTDALSTPLDAGLAWLVRFDKPQFHGREPLLSLREMEPRQRLVGFVMPDLPRVPAEGCQVVEDGVPVGRVTSSRYSPTLERSLGLAWVPARHAVGSQFLIRVAGMDLSARVVDLPFYDAEGKRLRL